MNSRLAKNLTILLAASGLGACGPAPEESTDSGIPAADTSPAADATSDATYQPVQKSVEDGRGGEADCRNAPGGLPPESGDILALAVDYDGRDSVQLNISFVGNARDRIAENRDTKYDGYVQAQIGTTYPFAASVASGQFETSPNSLAEHFESEWVSGSEVTIRIRGFESGGGPLVRAEVNTRSSALDPEAWCDKVTIEF